MDHPECIPRSEPGGRLAWVDRLRLVVVAAVVLIHVCEVFNPWDEWHITAPARSRVLGEVVVLFAPWVMPLLMLLGGFGAHAALAHRGNGAYLRERARRLLLPLALGILVLVPPQVYLERRLRGQFDGGFIEFYPHFFDGIYPEGNFSWHHLWFLGHLFLYSVIALPLFRAWQRGRARMLFRGISRLCRAPHGILWLAVPLVAERMVLWGLFPERLMLTSDWSNHALLFVAYIYGFLLGADPVLGAAIDAQWRAAASVALVTTAALMAGAWVGMIPGGLPGPYSLPYLGFWIVYAIGAWAWVVAVIGVARRWLAHDGADVEEGRRSAYMWYLVHQPVIVAVAYVVVTWRASVAAQFLVLLVASVAGTWLLSELVIRAGRVQPPGRRRFAMRNAPTRDSYSAGRYSWRSS